MRSLVRAVVALLGVASFPAVVFAFFHLLPLMADLFVLRRVEAYVPAVFQMEWARFDDATPVAVGTIAGRREIMSLADVLPRRATSLNDLQDLMAGKDRIEAGMIHVNRPGLGGFAHFPFGGLKHSSFGAREVGEDTLGFFTDLKSRGRYSGPQASRS